MSQQPDTSGFQTADGQSSTDNKDSGLAEPNSQPSKLGGNKYHILTCGKPLKCHEEIINHLQTLGLKEESVQECDVIVVLCNVVSRAGTDIEAALKKLNEHPESKAAIFVVLHCTFDPEKIVPDSSKCVQRQDTLTVDILFSEDTGLLQCMKNEVALDRIKQWAPSKVETGWYTWLFCSPNNLDEEKDQKMTGDEVASLPTCQTGLTVASELWIVLLGMSGSEKTAVGKMILGSKEMCEASISTVTQKITVEIGTVDKGLVYLIDTPDWFNSDLPLEDMKKNIHDCIHMCSCKPYAVLLVIPGKQFTEEQKEIESMKTFFEEIWWERVIILFTVTDEQEKQNIKAIIQKMNVHDIENRCYSLNISQTGNSAQVSELLKKIEDMIAGNKESTKLTELEKKTIAENNQERIERNKNYIKIQLPELEHTIWISKESKVHQFENMKDDSFEDLSDVSFPSELPL